METITDSGGSEKRIPPKHNPANLLACSGLRARLRLEQRLLKSKDGSGLQRGPDSAEIIVEICEKGGMDD
jgi:hypothetical protein